MALFNEQIRFFWDIYIYIYIFMEYFWNILIAHEIMGREGSFSILSF